MASISIMELMLAIDNQFKHLWYHKDTNIFDGCPVSANELKNIDMNEKIPLKDENNFCLPTYKEIDHEEIMRFYVREFVEDKEIRKQLFYILRRHDYVRPFIEELRKLDLYDDFEMIGGDIYDQIFREWAEKNELSFTDSGL